MILLSASVAAWAEILVLVIGRQAQRAKVLEGHREIGWEPWLESLLNILGSPEYFQNAQ
jgi:hypothetical protein